MHNVFKYAGSFPIVLILVLGSSCKENPKKSGQAPRQESVRMNEQHTKHTETGKVIPKVTKAISAERLIDNQAPLTKEEKRSAIDLMRSGEIETCKQILGQMPVGPLYEMLLGEFAQRYSQQDLEGSIRWIIQLPQEGHLQRGYSAIGFSASRKPDIAESCIADIRDRGLRTEFSSGYLLGLSQQTDNRTLQSLLNSPERMKKLGINDDIAFDSVVGGVASSKSVDQALDTVATLLNSGISPRPGAADSVLKRLASQDPNSVASFLAARKDSTNIAILTQPALEAWGEKDPIKASEWLTLQPEGALRDSGAAGFARAIARTEPQNAVKWAISIGNEELRSSTFRQIASRSTFEREQVRGLIQSSSFDAEAKSKYLAIFE